MLFVISAPFSHFLIYFCRSNKVTNNFGQKVGDKLTKLSKIGFSMECFTAGFLRFFTKTSQNLAFVGRLGTRHQIQAFQGFF